MSDKEKWSEGEKSKQSKVEAELTRVTLHIALETGQVQNFLIAASTSPVVEPQAPDSLINSAKNFKFFINGHPISPRASHTITP